eukprot:340338_1
MHLGLGEHGQVFDLGLAKGRAVGGDEDHLGLSGAESLDALLVSEDGLSGLHDELESGVHGLDILFLLGLKDRVETVRGEITKLSGMCRVCQTGCRMNAWIVMLFRWRHQEWEEEHRQPAA